MFIGNPGGIILPGLNSLLDTFIVEIGIILLLEALQDTLKIGDLGPQLITLLNHQLEGVAKLLNSHLGLLEKLGELAATSTSLDDLATFHALSFVVLLLQLDPLELQMGNLPLKVDNRSFRVPLCLLRLANELGASSTSLFQGLTPLFLNAAVLLANLGALVRALDASYARVLLATVAAEFVIAGSIVHVSEGYVSANMALVNAPEAGKRIGGVSRAGRRAGKGLRRRERI